MRRLMVLAASVGLSLAGVVAATPSSAPAVQAAQNQVVSDNPANFTPNVLDGQVEAIAQIGNSIILGGSFSQVQAATGGAILTRNNLVAFDATTGQISTSFVPNPDGEVDALIPAGDGTSVFIGGYFNNVAGGGSPSVARINATSGARVSGFKAPKLDGRVKDLRLANGRLWMAGYFTTVAGNAQTALATINPTTGAFDPYMRLPIAGVHNGGVTTVMKMDVDPAATRLVAIGNFDTISGSKHHQAFMLDLTGATAAAANWQTSFYTSACSSSFQSYMRDLDISPDGTYFVISTTGAYGGSTSACDETSRWDFSRTGSGLTPTWTDYTGGDTTYAVAITGTAVYTGGHARWQNNAYAGDKAGPGAVSRPGIAALDPVNGLPLKWNPTRDRGVGVFDMLATSTGLWVGSDTEHIGQNYEYHARIAYFPLSGGETIAANNPAALPGDVYVAGPLSGTTSPALSKRSFDGTKAGASSTAPTGGLSWSSARGAFMLNGQLYTGWSDGSFTRQSFNGTTYGTAVPVNTGDLLVPIANWHTNVTQATGMFFDGGRVYFTLAGSTNLYYRYFTPENDVVGTVQFTASPNVSGIDFSKVQGMFLASGKLYWATSDGNLHSMRWSAPAPVAGTAAVVSGPGIDGANWAARALFVGQGTGGGAVNQPPTARASVSCTGLTCSFDGSASTDPDGSVVGYSWSFGDGGTGTGAKVQHTYASAGSYSVKLTVSDDAGASASASQTTTVTSPTASTISFVGAAAVNANATSFAVTVPSGVTAGDALLLFYTANDTTATYTAPSGWTAVKSLASGGMVTQVYSRVAASGDAGTAVKVTSSAYVKGDLTVVAYDGTAAPTPVLASAIATETTSQASHTTPTVSVPADGAWLVSYWADKSSATTTMTAPAAVTKRSGATGSGSGRVTSLIGDSAGPVSGTVGGLTAVADSASSHAMMLSIVLGRTP